MITYVEGSTISEDSLWHAPWMGSFRPGAHMSSEPASGHPPCGLKVTSCFQPVAHTAELLGVLVAAAVLLLLPQPAWSAFREPSFGHGELQFLSETTAVWKWFR